MSAVPTLCWAAGHRQGASVGKEMRPQSSEQEQRPQHRNKLSTPSVFLAVALLPLVVPVARTMHPSCLGCCLALTVAGPFASQRRSGSAVFGLSPAPY